MRSGCSLLDHSLICDKLGITGPLDSDWSSAGLSGQIFIYLFIAAKHVISPLPMATYPRYFCVSRMTPPTALLSTSLANQYIFSTTLVVIKIDDSIHFKVKKVKIQIFFKCMLYILL